MQYRGRSVKDIRFSSFAVQETEPHSHRNTVRLKTAVIHKLKLFEEFIHRFVERNRIVVGNEVIALDEHQFSVGQTAVNKLGVSAFDQILRAHNNQSGSLDLGKLFPSIEGCSAIRRRFS